MKLDNIHQNDNRMGLTVNHHECCTLQYPLLDAILDITPTQIEVFHIIIYFIQFYRQFNERHFVVSLTFTNLNDLSSLYDFPRSATRRHKGPTANST